MYNPGKNNTGKYRAGLQTIDEKISHLLKPIFQNNKKHFLVINNLTKNWADIVGAKNSSNCHPQSLNFDREGKNGKLTISAYNSAIAFFLQSNSDLIIERIAKIYGFKGVSKIIIKQEPRNADNVEEKPIKLDKKSEEFLEEKIAGVEDKELAETLRKLGREIWNEKNNKG